MVRMAAGWWALGCFIFSLSLAWAGDTRKVLVGHLPVTGHVKLFVAKEMDFFAREGLDVELIDYINSADGMAALQAGKLDVGAFGTVAPLVYIAAGGDVRLFGGVMGEDAYVVALPDVAKMIHRPEDLKNMRIASVSLATGDTVFKGALTRAGLSLTDDVTLFSFSSPGAVIDAVQDRYVDMGVIWGPYDVRAEADGLRIVFSTSEMLPNHPCCRLVATGARYEEKIAAWPKFLRAVFAAEKFVAEPANREQVLNCIAKYVRLERQAIERTLYRKSLELSSDPNARGLEEIWNILVDIGSITPQESTDVQRFIETDPGLEALRSLREAEPEDPFWEAALTSFCQRNQVAMEREQKP